MTAYARSARLLSSRDDVDAAAGLLATEAYHAGAMRLSLGQFDRQLTTNAISAVGAKVGGGKDTGLQVGNLRYNIANVDSDGLTFRRTAQEVLGVVYNGVPAGGGFLPNQANGTIR